MTRRPLLKRPQYCRTLIILIVACILQPTKASDTLDFSFVWEESSFPNSSFSVLHDQMGRDYFYVTIKAGGLRIYDAANPEEPSLTQTVSITELQGLHVMNLFQQGNYLFLALGGHFGGQDELGVAIVDVTDPASPVVTDVWQSGPGKGSAIVVVDGDYAFLGAMTLGVIIFDISDKSNIQEVSQFIPDINWPHEDPPNVEIFNARGMAVRDGIIYLCYDGGGIRIVNVEDIENPHETGRYVNDVIVNEPKAYNNIVLNGDLAYVPVDYCGLEIIDVSDTSSIELVGWWNPWECETSGNIWFNSPGHTNEIVYNPEHEIVFLSGGDSELQVVDVSNPANATLVGAYGGPGNSQAVWGLTVHEQQVYLTYVIAVIPFFSNWAGVKIVDWQYTVGITEAPEPPSRFALHQNYPNPFNPSTMIKYELSMPGNVSLRIYNIRGRLARELVNRSAVTGLHSVVWDGTNDVGQPLASGVYYYQLRTDRIVESKKMLLVR